MTPHNEANLGDIAKTVLMPGDPLRAKYIAENFLEDYKLVNSVRGMYAYTGKYKGKEITVMAHGMGNPSIGIYSYELYKFYDVENIIRIGTSGAYVTDLDLLDLVLVDSSYSNSSFAKDQNGENSNLIYSSKSLTDSIYETAQKIGQKVKRGTVHCSDVFYSDVSDYKKMVEEHNCLSIEMESFALFHNANVLNKRAACILSISDSFVKPEKLTSSERQLGLNNMITLALESSINL